MAENLNRYTLGEVIGSGAYSDVFMSQDRETREEVAIKRTRVSLECLGLPHTLLRELSILRSLDHENVIKLLDSVITPQFAYCVFKFYPWDLRSVLNSSGPLEERSVKEVGRQILKGVEHFHARRVIHRDLKPENILLSKSGEVVIADFGISRSVCVRRPYTNEVQTLWYRAPEIIAKDGTYSSMIDIWSVGCILAELLTGLPLFNGMTEYEQHLKINSVIRGDFARNFTPLKDVSDSAFDLLHRMLKKEPNLRITATQALEHPFLHASN